MFCLEENHSIKNYTLINNVFFNQILPNVPMEYLRIYLLGYYYSTNPELYSSYDNDALAKALNIPVEKVLEAWDFLEKINLIRKHRMDKFTSTDYFVEFIDLNLYNKKSNNNSIKKAIYNINENKAKMYKQISEILGRDLVFHETKAIEDFLKVYDVPYNLVVEACSCLMFDKNSKDVNKMLEILNTWVKDGIQSSTDLDSYLSEKKQAYNNYRRILNLMGEYRNPTIPEIKIINKWLYDYNFDLEVIEYAISKSVSAKNPTLVYINGILTNWYNDYTKNKTKTSSSEDLNQYYRELTKIITFPSTPIDENTKKTIKFLAENYPINTVKTAVNYMKFNNYNDNKPITVFSIMEFLISSNQDAKTFGTIKLKDLEGIADRKLEKTKFKPKKTAEVEHKEYKDSELPYVDPTKVSDTQLKQLFVSNNSLEKYLNNSEDDE